MNDVLSLALSRGGHYADIFFEHTEVSSLELQDGAVSQATRAILHGAGVRALAGDRTGYAYTMDVSRPQLLKAARNASCIADGLSASPVVSAASPSAPAISSDSAYPSGSASSFTPFDFDAGAASSSSCPWSSFGVQSEMDALLHIDSFVRDLDPRVIRVKALLSHQTRQLAFYNSLGEHYSDTHPRAVLVVQVVMKQGDEVQMGYSTLALNMDATFLTTQRVEQVATEAVQRTRILFEAVKPEGGEMPVVLAAGASGIFMHEAIGHAFEADFVRKGTSIFAGRLGQQICRPDITIVDDGTIPFDAGSLRWDDEGIPGQRTILVDQGRLNSFLHDRISAQHFGVQPTGNGRRESFRSIPQPRMRSTYMLAGQAQEEDVIRSVKRGIYAQQFTNGQVQIGAGDFTFYMKQGYLIEDGHLTRPIRDINIIGNGPQALSDISMVANNLVIDHSAGMCGKGGQSVPVSQGLPTVLVDRLVVGGT